jgi:phosphoglycerate dehydrogenase-like enzyme
MMAWAKRVPTRMLAQQEHRWEQGFTHRLRGATLVVLGLGSIGTAVARPARALGMQVIGVRRTARPSRFASEVVSLADLADVLPRAEYLAVCCPDTPETRGVLGRREFALLPPGAFVVNVARGSVIDESALIEALRSGHLGGAGLDVFQQEPLQADSPLWDMPEVLISPHYPNTADYQQNTLRLFLDNLQRFRSRRRLRNVVNTRRGY